MRDSASGTILEEATISCWPVAADHPSHSLRSGRSGFSFHLSQAGDYRLIATYLGYVPDTIAFSISDKDTSTVFAKFILRPSSKPLMEVIVKASIPPVIVKADTIGFNAAAFPTRPYASVEDLLRKLPGIVVDKDGNVTMQGKKIDKILIDGKEFFLSDIKTATQNLPAEIVAQVETYDTQTEQGKLTGVRDPTGGKTLNIKLKKDRKKGYFGNAYAGAGSASGYAVGGTAASMDPTRNIFFNGSTNNISNLFTGRENNSGPVSGGLQTLSNGSLNYRDNLGKKIVAVFNGGFFQNQSTVMQSSSRQTFLGDSSLIENRLSNSSNKSNVEHFNVRMEYKMDSLRTMTLQSSWSSQAGNSHSTDTVGINTQKGTGDQANTWRSSHGLTDNTNKTHGYSLNNSVDFRQRFQKQGRTVYIGLSQSSNQQHADAGLYSLVDAFDSLGNNIQHMLQDQRSTQTSDNENYSVRANYTEPVGKKKIVDFGYQFSSSTSHSNKQSFDYDSATGRYDHPDTLTTNQFFNRNTNQNIHADFNSDGTKLHYQLGVAVQLTSLYNQNYSIKDPILQHFTNWYPRASLIWTLSQSRSIRLGYSGSSSAPSIDQLQPLPDLTNPFLVRIGNPGLQQSFQHNMDLGFNSINPKSLQNWQLSMQGGFMEHAITASTTLLAGGVQQLQYVNIEGNYQLSGNLAYGFPLWARHGNGSVGIQGNYAHQNGFINGEPNSTSTSGLGGSLQLSYHPAEKAFFDVNGSLNYSSNAYSLNKDQNSNVLVQNYTADFSYELPWALTISSYYNWQQTGAQGSLPAHATSYWNAACYKSIFRNHSGQIRLSVFNLLNSASNVSQSAGPNFIASSRSNIVGRLWLLSFVWHFRKFPSGGK
ncbi:MAG TPA: outer membrane beta-barrel protein [Puia sp.]|nr:outer membrane beta-barrel protein [Puia sp.]